MPRPQPGPRPAPGPGAQARPRPDRRPDPTFDHAPRYRRPGYYYYPRYYYPRYTYPYGYGAFGGLGYFYYDPYQWYPSQQLYWLGPGYYGHGAFFDIGFLRLNVYPDDAQVYVDGTYAGIASDYEDTLRAMKLEIGTYRIDLVLPGYETLSFDVQIRPGQTITYEGQLMLAP